MKEKMGSRQVSVSNPVSTLIAFLTLRLSFCFLGKRMSRRCWTKTGPDEPILFLTLFLISLYDAREKETGNQGRARSPGLRPLLIALENVGSRGARPTWVSFSF